jgi:hypothetical protein
MTYDELVAVVKQQMQMWREIPDAPAGDDNDVTWTYDSVGVKPLQPVGMYVARFSHMTGFVIASIRPELGGIPKDTFYFFDPLFQMRAPEGWSAVRHWISDGVGWNVVESPASFVDEPKPKATGEPALPAWEPGKPKVKRRAPQLYASSTKAIKRPGSEPTEKQITVLESLDAQLRNVGGNVVISEIHAIAVQSHIDDVADYGFTNRGEAAVMIDAMIEAIRILKHPTGVGTQAVALKALYDKARNQSADFKKMLDNQNAAV